MFSALRPAARPLPLLLSALAGAALLAASAQLRVPMWPVPMTMQTLAVLLIGAACGAAGALAATGAYLAAAAAGLPVLAGGAAFGGPTMGYLAGFLLAALLLGVASDRQWLRRPLALFAWLMLAQAVIYLCGLAWLRAAWLPDLSTALQAGLIPFLPGDAIKLALAFTLLHAARRLT